MINEDDIQPCLREAVEQVCRFIERHHWHPGNIKGAIDPGRVVKTIRENIDVILKEKGK